MDTFKYYTAIEIDFDVFAKAVKQLSRVHKLLFEVCLFNGLYNRWMNLMQLQI